MGKNLSKQKVIDAASELFFQYGFHGTSVRDIAKRASVNVSLISYYFKNKQGLLEHAIIQYYEAYLQMIETVSNQATATCPLDHIKQLVEAIIQYKQTNHQLSCFIHRELSLDSVFVREMTVTYLAKENYFIREALFSALSWNRISGMDKQFLLMQLKGMLVTPYVLQHEWKNQVIGQSSHDAFVEKYVRLIHDWLDYVVNRFGPVTLK
ncbi:MAG TPA: forespore capture DNA-binding protein RefZ [Bacillota bacterium]|nr:forespore capture DNA-binding protein RefZ [Bacillota bacterium]